MKVCMLVKRTNIMALDQIGIPDRELSVYESVKVLKGWFRTVQPEAEKQQLYAALLI